MNFDTSVLQVPIEDIIPNRFQPRLVFNDASLNELANSIKEHGIIQPLVLRRLNDKYEIVAGERRYKAAKIAGLSSVPAVITLIDDRKSAEIAVAENVQREELSPIEEAKSYKAILDQGFMSDEQLAKKLGLPVSSILSKLKLLELSPEVQNALMEGKISERHAKSLLALNDHDKEVQWLNKIIIERLNVRTLDELIKKENGGETVMMDDDEKYTIAQIKEEKPEVEEAPVLTNTLDINKIKESAQDIEVPSVSNLNLPTEIMGAIDLGERRTQKFFNSLEDEAVNMQMTEAINPFNTANRIEVPSPSSPALTQEPEPNVVPAVEDAQIQDPAPIVESAPATESTPAPVTEEVSLSSEIESLDFLPDSVPNVTSLSSSQLDDKLVGILNDLQKESSNFSFIKTDLADEIVYTITIKK